MRMRAHMVQWSGREIEEKHGIRCVSSMWKGVGVYKSVEIVPERSQKDHVIWELVSWKGSVILDVWLQAIPYLRFSKERSVVWFWMPLDF